MKTLKTLLAVAAMILGTLLMLFSMLLRAGQSFDLLISLPFAVPLVTLVVAIVLRLLKRITWNRLQIASLFLALTGLLLVFDLFVTKKRSSVFMVAPTKTQLYRIQIPDAFEATVKQDGSISLAHHDSRGSGEIQPFVFDGGGQNLPDALKAFEGSQQFLTCCALTSDVEYGQIRDISILSVVYSRKEHGQECRLSFMKKGAMVHKLEICSSSSEFSKMTGDLQRLLAGILWIE